MQKKLKKLLPSLHLVSDWPRLILRFSIILIFSKFLFSFKEFDLQKISFSFSTLLGISIICIPKFNETRTSVNKYFSSRTWAPSNKVKVNFSNLSRIVNHQSGYLVIQISSTVTVFVKSFLKQVQYPFYKKEIRHLHPQHQSRPY